MKLITALLFTLLVSCHNHRNYSFHEYNAGIHIQRSVGINPNSPNAAGESLTVAISNYSNTFPSVIKVNSYVLNKDNQYSMDNFGHVDNLSSNLFGHDIKIQLDSEMVVSNFYCPEPLFVGYDVPTYQMNMAAGMSFHWTPDSKSQGITVTVRASSVSNTGLDTDIVLTTRVNDNGRFVIPSKWIKQLPKKAYVTLRIERINQHIYRTKTNQNILVQGSSTCHGSFFVMDEH